MPPWQWQRRFLVLMGASTLRLADGRGWAFDDSALFPHDPSVVCLWRSFSPKPSNSGSSAFSFPNSKPETLEVPKGATVFGQGVATGSLLSVVPPGANAAAVAAAVANGTAGGGAMTDVAGSMGSMGSMKPTMDYGNQKFARSRSEPVDPELVCTALPKALHRACHFGTMDFIWCSRSHSAKPKPVPTLPNLGRLARLDRDWLGRWLKERFWGLLATVNFVRSLVKTIAPA